MTPGASPATDEMGEVIAYFWPERRGALSRPRSTHTRLPDARRPGVRADMIRPVVRIVVTTLVLTVTGMLSGGCGGGKSNSASGPVTEAQALAYARAVNLRAADLLAHLWFGTGHETEARVWHGNPLSLCEGSRVRTGEVIRIISPIFRLKPEVQRIASLAHFPNAIVHSTVYVTHNVALARQDITVARECVARLLARRTASPEQGTFAPLNSSLPGARVVGLRMTMPTPVELNGTGVRVPRYRDTLVFAAARAEIALDATGISQPFPSATERRLLALLYSRASSERAMSTL
jgi:hypothetical protein